MKSSLSYKCPTKQKITFKRLLEENFVCPYIRGIGFKKGWIVEKRITGHDLNTGRQQGCRATGVSCPTT
jgi:hypothetical protein